MVSDKKLKASFWKVSSLYDTARPSYPSKLIDDILKISKIKKNGKILDVGCGPGTATKLFAKKGYSIIGIDIGKELISLAKKNSPKNASYKAVSFEDVKFRTKTFDLIISAQAWHWIKPKIALSKANELLKDNGYLALFWKFEESEKDIFIQKLIRLYIKYCGKKSGKPKSIINAEKALKETDLFYPYKKKEYHIDMGFTRKKYYDMIHTFSWIINLPIKAKKEFESRLNDLLSKKEDPFTVPFKYTLLIAKKKSK
ncbi:class I SAM-dependent methyltransferase [Candidatus Woesearchaeota archaeon]|nr:class I SAM-dependent methyltransferase [Candidatus Woesearchaeota archaeon]